MTSHGITDPPVESAIAEADRRVERAKASLLSRVEALKHKLGDTRDKVHVSAQIARHPLPAVGIALALGALLGLRGTRPAVAADPTKRSLGRVAFAGFAAFGLRMLKELAVAELGEVARRWRVEPGGMSHAAPTASGVTAVEPFVEQ